MGSIHTTLVYTSEPELWGQHVNYNSINKLRVEKKLRAQDRIDSSHPKKNEVANRERRSVSKVISNTVFGINYMLGCFWYSNQGCILGYSEKSYLQWLECSQVRPFSSSSLCLFSQYSLNQTQEFCVCIGSWCMLHLRLQVIICFNYANTQLAPEETWKGRICTWLGFLYSWIR